MIFCKERHFKMKKFKRTWNWYYMLNKRFFKKYIFTFLLLCIPLLTLGIKILPKEDSGILNVLLYENGKDTISKSIVEELLHLNGIVTYTKIEQVETGIEQVQRGHADSLWVFPENFSEGIDQYLKHKTPLITVYVSEDTVQTKIVREQLFGTIYPILSYRLLEHYHDQQPYSKLIEDLDQKVSKTYEMYQLGPSILEFSHLDGSPISTQNVNYLAMPLRGMLAVFLLFCSLSTTMFYLQDQQEGIFLWMPIKHKRLFPYLYILIGTLNGAMITWISIYLSGSFTTLQKELPLMILYVFSITGFCNIIAKILRTVKRMGTATLVITLVSLILCPVFIQIDIFPFLQHLLPTYYYLNGLYQIEIIFQMLLYAAFSFLFGLLLQRN